MQIDITMKRLLSLMALCCLVFVACGNDENLDNGRPTPNKPAVDKIVLSHQVIEVGFEPDTYSVSVTSSYDWDAFSESDWIEVVTHHGDAGVTELAFNVTMRNTELKKHLGSIKVVNGEHNLVAELSVVQKIFEPILNVQNKSVLEFGYKGGEQSIFVESNFEYDIATDADWVILSKTTTGVVVKVSYNIGDARTANVTISSAKYNLSGKVIPITQQKVKPVREEYAVDLGLSVKWANCNVGAECPEEYGDYFAWGEVSPKDEYTTQTYQYWTDDNGDGFGDSWEYADLGDILGNPQYDAATANWGGAWRMPTSAEQQELLSNCTWEWTTLKGVYGCKVTGPNGNSIFLPAAGYRWWSSSNLVGSSGYYWSSTPNEVDGGRAFTLHFYSGYDDWYWGPGDYGFSVRAVSE